jgi:hypothetical protein
VLAESPQRMITYESLQCMSPLELPATLIVALAPLVNGGRCTVVISILIHTLIPVVIIINLGDVHELDGLGRFRRASGERGGRALKNGLLRLMSRRRMTGRGRL